MKRSEGKIYNISSDYVLKGIWLFSAYNPEKTTILYIINMYKVCKQH